MLNKDYSFTETQTCVVGNACNSTTLQAAAS